ncbi:5-oxoprolinase subunit PxpA [Dokdonia sinensis]|uniref:5-oxoprolinase subunit PxpA n=1 Tax=Dokdonia sinensis TaxID=2479847 RepID=A0A3M0FX00_9FLAO|nr:5-oxoprolinase subunit PxpA [Dokdonia sinensis]
MKAIDINSDVGEGIGNEAQLMPYLTSCNIACGGHAGDEKTIETVICLAMKHSVKIGAHPSYPDRANFGRKEIDISDLALKASIKEQVERVAAFAKAYKSPLHHIKPHGALYNKAARDEKTARLIVETVLEIDENLVLYVPYKSVIATVAQGKLKTLTEGFADRAYNKDYSLASRTTEGAVLDDVADVIKHCFQMISNKLVTIEGHILPFYLDTLCVHGDNPQALYILEKLTTALKRSNIKIC